MPFAHWSSVRERTEIRDEGGFPRELPPGGLGEGRAELKRALFPSRIDVEMWVLVLGLGSGRGLNQSGGQHHGRGSQVSIRHGRPTFDSWSLPDPVGAGNRDSERRETGCVG